MDPLPVVDVLGGHGCEFVVVGSGARFMLGEDVVPADLDVVVSGLPANRVTVVRALIELDGCLVDGERLQPLTPTTVLPWEWSWKVVTAYGPVDMIVHFIDGSGFDEHNRAAVDVVGNDGRMVRCHATRHFE